jgi:hypothetical protein
MPDERPGWGYKHTAANSGAPAWRAYAAFAGRDVKGAPL